MQPGRARTQWPWTTTPATVAATGVTAGGSAGSPQCVRPWGCGLLRPVPSPPSARARAVSWATWHLFTGVHAWCLVLRVRCPGQLGSCSAVCTLDVSSPESLSAFVFFFVLLFGALVLLSLLFFLRIPFSFEKEEKSVKGHANTASTDMGIWSSGAAVLCSSSCLCFSGDFAPGVRHACLDVQGRGLGWVWLGVSARRG